METHIEQRAIAYYRDEYKVILKIVEGVKDTDILSADRKIYIICQLITGLENSITTFKTEFKDAPSSICDYALNYYRGLLSPEILRLIDNVVNHS